jgi:hypothetical protein
MVVHFSIVQLGTKLNGLEDCAAQELLLHKSVNGEDTRKAFLILID